MNDARCGFDFGTELPYFQNLWDERGSQRGEHTAAIWDERAAEWIAELDAANVDSSLAARVEAMAAYLRSKGLLTGEQHVLDVGCGMGSFVLEFARTAKYVMGMDFSSRFLEYGQSVAERMAVENVCFSLHDLLTLDVDEAGFSGAFHLVFASINPALTAKGCLQKLMQMSKSFCCNVSFLHTDDSLLKGVISDVYAGKVRSRRDGMGFYTLLNLLLLSGFYPETHYFTVETRSLAVPNRKLAVDLASDLRLDAVEDVDKILSYLEKKGETDRISVSRFGSILWGIKEQ